MQIQNGILVSLTQIKEKLLVKERMVILRNYHR